MGDGRTPIFRTSKDNENLFQKSELEKSGVKVWCWALPTALNPPLVPWQGR